MSDELMELPEGWAWANTSEVCASVRDGTHDTPKYFDEGIPLVTSKNLRNDRIDFSTARNISLEDHQQISIRSGVEDGDILFAMIGTIGNPVVVNEDREFSIKNIGLFKKNEQIINSNYLKFWLSSHSFQKILDDQALIKGTTQKFIPLANLRIFPVTLPPLNEQKRIVAKIEELRERSQKARSHLSAIPNLCDKFRQSVLAAAFRGDLTADWREQNPDVEPASVLLERIRRDGQQRSIRKKTNLGELDLSTLPEIPETWKWEQLIKISGLLGGVTKGRKFNGQVTVQVPYLRVANVQDGFLDLEEIKEIEVLPEDINKYRLEHGDILFTEGGDRDKLGRGTVWRNEIAGCIHQNHVYRSRLYSSEMLPEYVSLAAKSKYAKDYFFHNASQTVNLASINMTTLGKLPLPIPPTDEQKEICSIVYKLFEIAEIIKTNHSKLFHQLDQLDRSILAKAFRGELVEQDPNDEPASVLLERIRAEREQQAQGKAKKPGKKGQRTIKTDPP